MRCAAGQGQACGSGSAYVQQTHTNPAALQKPGRPGEWHVYIGLQLAMGQDDVRPAGISSAMPGTKRGHLAWARPASDVSGSLQVNLGISAGKAHLI